MFNPANAADEIKKQYIGYINTTFHFRNQNLQNKLFVEYRSPGTLFNAGKNG